MLRQLSVVRRCLRLRNIYQSHPSLPHFRYCAQAANESTPPPPTRTTDLSSPRHSPQPPAPTIAPNVKNVKWEVTAVDDGSRLDRFIKRRAPGVPPGLIQRLIRKRSIMVQSIPAIRNAHPVRTGDVVTFPGHIKLGLSRGKRKPQPDDISLAESAIVKHWVLHRDARCVVLNKPAGLPTQGGSSVGTRHLEALLPGIGEGRYWLVHRLDKEVGGAIVVARDVGAAGLLAEHFRGRLVRKTYWALVEGSVKDKTGFIDLPIDGKRARTDYRVIQSLDKKFVWLELSPRTGRKHQLRIHCADGLGTPIVGDGKYGHGGPEGLDGQNVDGGLLSLMNPGLHLFSREIQFPKLTQHMSGGGKRSKRTAGSDGTGFPTITARAPLPPHMKDTWKRFGLEEHFAA
ncbi:unnamed protein product [Chondrus crispus]|uniref:RNA-binding S4 domain-containing protein n=1 Tax=Chondrus crispus TaxID=2769 RepID=R7QAD7_CHOCR|nr:unnamed protein product [Chondrus crispus]CDF34430.1 unnamed protein product [Chondrus crispus]|eukprot:XP_005714249.1 unnamed protein product [Chondrus crispus]